MNWVIVNFHFSGLLLKKHHLFRNYIKNTEKNWFIFGSTSKMLFLGIENNDCLPTLPVLGFFSGLEATLSECSLSLFLEEI